MACKEIGILFLTVCHVSIYFMAGPIMQSLVDINTNNASGNSAVVHRPVVLTRYWWRINRTVTLFGHFEIIPIIIYTFFDIYGYLNSILVLGYQSSIQISKYSLTSLINILELCGSSHKQGFGAKKETASLIYIHVEAYTSKFLSSKWMQCLNLSRFFLKVLMAVFFIQPNSKYIYQHS